MTLRSVRLSAAAFLSLPLLLACGDDQTTSPATGNAALRVVNALSTPVDVLVDGTVAASGVSAGTIDSITVSSGAHTVAMRAAGTTTSTQRLTAAAGALPTLAALRTAAGLVDVASLDDTNSVVPSGATKLRVLHLAAGAGELQVYRVQPDVTTPTRWQFPFTYQSTVTSLTAPFYQSTPGTWDVRVWSTPADATGWAGASLRALVPLESGQKATVVILDKPGGGVRIAFL